MCEILPVLLVLLAATGCHSHRATVTHEAARYQRAILDSTVSSIDTLRRVDSAAVQWLERAVLLEWDSVDYRLMLDSAGRTVGISGKRMLSRRTSGEHNGAVSSAQSLLQARSMQSAVERDSVSHELSQSIQQESKSGVDLSSPISWFEWVLFAILMVLAIVGVIHLRELTERWSRRR